MMARFREEIKKLVKEVLVEMEESKDKRWQEIVTEIRGLAAEIIEMRKEIKGITKEIKDEKEAVPREGKEGEGGARPRSTKESREERTMRVSEEEEEEKDHEIDVWKRIEAKLEEERRKKEGEEKKEKDKEKERKNRRERSIIWCEVESQGKEERMEAVERMIERIIGEKGRVGWIEERKTEEEIKFIITEMTEKEERDKIMEKKEELRRRWDMRIDEDLNTEERERERRRRIADKTREERKKGREVEWTARKLWLDGEEWIWESKEEGWRKKREGEADKDTDSRE